MLSSNDTDGLADVSVTGSKYKAYRWRNMSPSKKKKSAKDIATVSIYRVEGDDRIPHGRFTAARRR